MCELLQQSRPVLQPLQPRTVDVARNNTDSDRELLQARCCHGVQGNICSGRHPSLIQPQDKSNAVNTVLYRGLPEQVRTLQRSFSLSSSHWCRLLASRSGPLVWLFEFVSPGCRGHFLWPWACLMQFTPSLDSKRVPTQ